MARPAKWSLERGLTVKRKGNPKEATIEAHMAAADGHSSSAKREAREFLQEALREGPVLQQEVILISR
jgi:hypothetical protein